jgi:hypothetical protein
MKPVTNVRSRRVGSGLRKLMVVGFTASAEPLVLRDLGCRVNSTHD